MKSGERWIVVAALLGVLLMLHRNNWHRKPTPESPSETLLTEITSVLRSNGGIVIVCSPDQMKLERVGSMLLPGDGLLITSDGRKHYWDGDLYLDLKTNVTTFLFGIHYCCGIDTPACDIVDFWSLMDMDIWEETKDYR